MTSRDFVYWLQGFAEINSEDMDGSAPTAKQWQVIKNHLNLVFKHEIYPSMPDPDGKLQAVHDNTINQIKQTFPYATNIRPITYRC